MRDLASRAQGRRAIRTQRRGARPRRNPQSRTQTAVRRPGCALGR